MGALTEADAPGLSAALLAWWERHGRVGLPWKLLPDGVSPVPGQDLDPYGIWIAEVMLQQTQLSVALPYWRRWMTAFPTVEALAAASLDEVRLQWQGLGYYSRARRLMRRRSSCGRALAWLGGVDGVAGHWSHHRWRHPFQYFQCVADPGWQRQTDVGAIDGPSAPAGPRRRLVLEMERGPA